MRTSQLGFSRRVRFAYATHRKRAAKARRRALTRSQRGSFLGLVLAVLCFVGSAGSPSSTYLTEKADHLALTRWLIGSWATIALASAACQMRAARAGQKAKQTRAPRPSQQPLDWSRYLASWLFSSKPSRAHTASSVRAALIGLPARSVLVDVDGSMQTKDLVNQLRARKLIPDPDAHPIDLVFPPYSRAPLPPDLNLLQAGVANLSTIHAVFKQLGGAQPEPQGAPQTGEPSQPHARSSALKRPLSGSREEQARPKRLKPQEQPPKDPALEIGPPPRMVGSATRQLAKAREDWLHRMVEEFYPEAVDAGKATLIPIQASLIELAIKYEIEAEEQREKRKEEERKAKGKAPEANAKRPRAVSKPPPPRKEYSVRIAPLMDVPTPAEAPHWRSEESKKAIEKTSANRKEKRGNMSKLRRKFQTAERNRTRPKEVFSSEPSQGFSVEGLPVASSGWMGMNMNRQDMGRKLVRMFKNGSIGKELTTFTRVPFADNLLAQLPTVIADVLGRVVVARSRIAKWQLDLMPKFIQEAAEFVRRCKLPFTPQEMADHARGLHWFSICGHDRNNKTTPALSGFHVRNAEAIQWFFRPRSPMRLISDCVTPFVAANFPGVANRFRLGSQEIRKRYGIEPQYGLFYNFCLNAARPSKQVKRVHCLPHTDWKNLALAVCVVFVYGNFDHREKCWLVIWEAGVIIEIPPCVFIAYPSALFYHFNVDIADIQTVYTPDGAFPTPQNSRPLPSRSPTDGWAAAEGRGSCVWFNQASMFQTAEIGEDTIKKAQAKGKSTVCDNESLLEKMVFATIDSEKGIPEPTL